MTGGDPSQRDIVHTWTDNRCGTGEAYYETRDGRVWKTCHSTPHSVTGQLIGYLRNGRIEER